MFWKPSFSQGYVGAKIWEYVVRLQAMKTEKILWLDNLNEEGIWVLSVDGTHCWIKEPKNPEFSHQDKSKEYSHQLNKAGKSYELGIHLMGGLIWMNGPYDAGENDIQIFRKQAGRIEGTSRFMNGCVL
jgi:hypothetical protein